jgi:DNA invertase Pin-like site-specific DNA recombinase
MSKINAVHLARQACVYVRQSTPGQVQNNLESKRGQYALADRAKQLGWTEVEIIDDDLGRSGGGTHRPGFERLLGSLCDGKIGAVFSIEASRLARNGRDWHTLLEFCSVAGVLLIDANSIYDPSQIDDRLMLGMKGTISEMEVATFRQRAQAALEQKARRGALFRRVAIGYARTVDDRIEKDPDARVRAAIDLVFSKFGELASVRQVYFWLLEQQIKVPSITGAGSAQQVVWNPPRYHTLLSLLRNPIYAGAYVYGRSKAKVRIDQGRKSIVQIRNKNREQWMVLLPDRHEAYIGWAAYESNQEMIANNANGKGELVRGSVKRGGALLAGLLRCGHCGGKLLAQYPGPTVIRYQCSGYVLDREASCCVSFGGLRADLLVAEQVLASLKPLGLQAAIQAIENLQGCDDERVHHKSLALQQACYEVAHARRQYDAVDPAHRLVAAELERRWNEAMKLQTQLTEELVALEREKPSPLDEVMKAELLALADDLPRLWDHPNSSHEFKKRILRTVLKQIITSADGDTIRLVLHWQGGDHTEISLQKTRTGMHRYVTDTETVELIRALARIQPDSMIASVLNRLGRRTARDQNWSARRVCSIRQHHAIDVYREGERQARGELTVSEVASMLGVTETTILRMIRHKQLLAAHACDNAPWILLRQDVEKFTKEARQAGRMKTRNSNQIEMEIQ